MLKTLCIIFLNLLDDNTIYYNDNDGASQRPKSHFEGINLTPKSIIGNFYFLYGP